MTTLSPGCSACSAGTSSSSLARPARVSVKPPDGNVWSEAIVNSVRSDIACGPTIGGGGGGGGGGDAQPARISAAKARVAVAKVRHPIMVEHPSCCSRAPYRRSGGAAIRYITRLEKWQGTEPQGSHLGAAGRRKFEPERSGRETCRGSAGA